MYFKIIFIPIKDTPSTKLKFLKKREFQKEIGAPVNLQKANLNCIVRYLHILSNNYAVYRIKLPIIQKKISNCKKYTLT